MTLKRLMFGCMLGQALKCLTARWTPKAVYFRNAMRVKPSPRTKHIALAGDPQADAAPICLQNTYIPDSLVHQCFFFCCSRGPSASAPKSRARLRQAAGERRWGRWLSEKVAEEGRISVDIGCTGER